MPLVEFVFELYACCDVHASWGHFWHWARPCHVVGKLKNIGPYELFFFCGDKVVVNV